jgi:hypothetical protein
MYEQAPALAARPQVGIVALNLIGEPLAPAGAPMYLSDVVAPHAGELSYYNRWAELRASYEQPGVVVAEEGAAAEAAAAPAAAPGGVSTAAGGRGRRSRRGLRPQQPSLQQPR